MNYNGIEINKDWVKSLKDENEFLQSNTVINFKISEKDGAIIYKIITNANKSVQPGNTEDRPAKSYKGNNTPKRKRNNKPASNSV